MDAEIPGRSLRILTTMNDPRDPRGQRHRLIDILTIAICATICGADGDEDIALFGRERAPWFATFLALPHGIPSHDTFGRVLGLLAPEQFETCFVAWMRHLAQTTRGRLIALDGKTLRRSFDTAAEKAAIHMVSAWCTANEAVLGQIACEAKSNEITALPRLLELLDLKGAVVTADAMHCQRETARRIVDGGGDYLLQVKDNHPTLHENLKLLFAEGLDKGCQGVSHTYAEDVDAGHGRIETRRCWTVREVEGLSEPGAWKGLRSVACVERTRDVGGKISTERAYYISSLSGTDAGRILRCTREHWQVENQLHWRLDVVFGEDLSRHRKGLSAENHSRLRRIALNLLKADTTRKASIRQKRKIAGWTPDYLLHLLTSLK